MPEFTAKDVVRAWKDEEYMNSLPQDVQDQIPPAPEGADQISDEDLEAAAGGGTPVASVVIGAASLAVSTANTIRHWND